MSRLCVCSYLGRDPYQQQPLLLLVSSVVYYLTSCQTGMPIKYFGRLGIPLHAPVIDGRIRHQGNSVYWYPLPEHDLLCHGVSLHLALHLNIENLQCLGSWEGGEETEGWSETADKLSPEGEAGTDSYNEAGGTSHQKLSSSHTLGCMIIINTLFNTWTLFKTILCLLPVSHAPKTKTAHEACLT